MNNYCNNDCVEASCLFETIAAMRSQESSVYKCRIDYLSSSGDGDASSSLTDVLVQPRGSSSKIGLEWREKICEWYFKMADHFQFSREIVSVSLSYLDRYLTEEVALNKQCDDNLAQLAAMTALHLAVKLFEPRKLKMSSLAGLSRGSFRTETIEWMELSMLKTLKWRVHPTTYMTFLDQFFKIFVFQNPKEQEQVDELFEIARFLTELAVCDCYFINEFQSHVAYACILVAIEFSSSSSLSSICTPAVVDEFASNMTNIARIRHDDPAIVACRSRVKDIYMKSVVCQSGAETITSFQRPKTASKMHQSPTSVCRSY